MADGRFAPSPTGPLHFGSLVAAVASYLQARTTGGRWLLRVEDLDPPREAPGSVAAILGALDRFGFDWDGQVTYQSHHGDRYQAALDRLIRDGHAYPCACTRKEIADTQPMGSGSTLTPSVDGGLVYQGTCRDGLPPDREGRAWRVRTDDVPVVFEDAVQGTVEQRLESEVGDFVIKRADGFWAYQLAVVVDDAADGITEVVRGADLIDSTARQIHLQRLLGLPTPRYLHVPVAVDGDGEKLSKSTGAVPLGTGHEASALWHALAFLDQDPPGRLQRDALDAVWHWARDNWRTERIPKTRSVSAPTAPP